MEKSTKSSYNPELKEKLGKYITQLKIEIQKKNKIIEDMKNDMDRRMDTVKGQAKEKEVNSFLKLKKKIKSEIDDLENKLKKANEKYEREEQKRKEEEERIKKLKEERRREKSQFMQLERKYKEIEKEKEKNLQKIYERNLDAIEEKDVKEVLEDMVLLEEQTKKDIEKELKEQPEKFISIEEAIEENKEDSNSHFILGVLGKSLQDEGSTVVINKNKQDQEISQQQSSTSLQFLVNGMSDIKKYEFHFDTGSEKNNLELLTDMDKQKKYNETLRKNLAKILEINEDDIIITNAKRGSYSITIIFKNENFYNISNEEIKKKIEEGSMNDEEMQKLGKLLDIKEDLLCSTWKLTPEMLDSHGNSKGDDYGVNEVRGGMPYTPPLGWERFGLNVKGKYDKGKNTWLAHVGCEGEWAIAYHGIGHNQVSESVKKITGLIAGSEFKAGVHQRFKNSKDINHEGQLVGEGVYCTPNPQVIEKYAGIVDIKGDKYKVAFMLRVHPEKIRIPEDMQDYWVVSGTQEDIRPYGILLKKV